MAMRSPNKDFYNGTGGTTVANYSNYEKGLNGVIVSIANAAVNGVGQSLINAGDFEFHTSNDGIAPWVGAPNPSAVLGVPRTDGSGITDVYITWDAGDIMNTWLRVTVRANSSTRLPIEDVLYWGHQIGDGTGDTATTGADSVAVWANLTGFSPAGINNPYDYNRDGSVTGADSQLVWANLTNFDPVVGALG